MLARIVALAALVLPLAACASDFGEDDPTPEAPATMSTPIPVPSQPSQSPRPSQSSQPAEAEQPVLEATFEPASADCNGWLAEGARSIRSVPARSGSYSCKLCADGSNSGFTLSHEIGAPDAGRYVFHAYTRKRPQNPAPAITNAFVEAATREGTLVVAANETAVRDEWDRLEAVIEVPAGATSLRVQIGTPVAASDECIVVDDVSIEKL